LPDELVLARYLSLAGAARFAIEFIRINPRVALGMTVAQFGSIGLVLAGFLLWLKRAHIASSQDAASPRSEMPDSSEPPAGKR